MLHVELNFNFLGIHIDLYVKLDIHLNISYELISSSDTSFLCIIKIKNSYLEYHLGILDITQ